jgi:hypothetical protein
MKCTLILGTTADCHFQGNKSAYALSVDEEWLKFLRDSQYHYLDVIIFICDESTFYNIFCKTVFYSQSLVQERRIVRFCVVAEPLKHDGIYQVAKKSNLSIICYPTFEDALNASYNLSTTSNMNNDNGRSAVFIYGNAQMTERVFLNYPDILHKIIWGFSGDHTKLGSHNFWYILKDYILKLPAEKIRPVLANTNGYFNHDYDDLQQEEEEQSVLPRPEQNVDVHIIKKSIPHEILYKPAMVMVISIERYNSFVDIIRSRFNEFIMEEVTRRNTFKTKTSINKQICSACVAQPSSGESDSLTQFTISKPFAFSAPTVLFSSLSTSRTCSNSVAITDKTTRVKHTISVLNEFLVRVDHQCAPSCWLSQFDRYTGAEIHERFLIGLNGSIASSLTRDEFSVCCAATAVGDGGGSGSRELCNNETTTTDLCLMLYPSRITISHDVENCSVYCTLVFDNLNKDFASRILDYINDLHIILGALLKKHFNAKKTHVINFFVIIHRLISTSSAQLSLQKPVEEERYTRHFISFNLDSSDRFLHYGITE